VWGGLGSLMHQGQIVLYVIALVVFELAAEYETTTTIILRLSGFCPGNSGEPLPEETFIHSHLSCS